MEPHEINVSHQMFYKKQFVKSIATLVMQLMGQMSVNYVTHSSIGLSSSNVQIQLLALLVTQLIMLMKLINALYVVLLCHNVVNEQMKMIVLFVLLIR